MLFLHISDIHFRYTEAGEPDDPNAALRNDMIADVRRQRGRIGAVDWILISGDIAHGGLSEEYDFARKWLDEELCPAAGCPIENVFVIPGNHDVNWKAQAGPAQIGARELLRSKAANQINNELRAWMRDKASSDVIFGPIDNYNRFAATYLCSMGPYREGDVPLASRPFAQRDLSMSDGSTLRLWGFNSVLVSNVNDGPNTMLVDPAASQMLAADGVTDVVLCHHPFSWIRNRQAFEDRINKLGKVQLFGHEHTLRVEEARRYVRIRAGALQPARDDPEWKPGYNWIALDVLTNGEKRDLDVRVWARQYEVSQYIALPNPEGDEVWHHTVPLPGWTKPKSASKRASRKSGEDSPPSEESRMPSPDVRSITFKMFRLNEHEQRRLVVDLRLDEDVDKDLRDYEVAILAVKRALERGRLDELEAEIDKILSES